MGKPLGGDSKSHRRSRTKGNLFELEVAKALSLTLYDREGVLRRTPLSGGWSMRPLGDICADSTALREGEHPPDLLVECKSRAGILLTDFLPVGRGRIPWLLDVWQELKKSAPRGAGPMLVVKGNGWKTPLAFTEEIPFLGPESWTARVRIDGGLHCWPFSQVLERRPEFRDWAFRKVPAAPAE